MMRWPFSLRPLLNVIISTAIVALFTGILFLLRSYLSTSVVALLYLVPVVISAAFLGLLAGVTASVQSFLIFNYFFIAPYYTFQATHPQDLLAMIVLLGVAILISNLMAIIQSNLLQVQTREHEAVQLYELSVDLAGKKNKVMIARTLAQRLAGLFTSSTIEVEVYPDEEKILVR